MQVSNLSRQFLFREHHVGSAKAVRAAEAARGMNPGMHINALEQVGKGDRTQPRLAQSGWDGVERARVFGVRTIIWLHCTAGLSSPPLIIGLHLGLTRLWPLRPSPSSMTPSGAASTSWSTLWTTSR
jgi:hypothetical protein